MNATTRSEAVLRPLRLGAGQARCATVRGGTVFQVLAGAVRVSEPSRWLAERLITPATLLAEGQALQVEAGGWVEVLAVGGAAQVLVTEPASAWAALWRRLLPRMPLARQRA